MFTPNPFLRSARPRFVSRPQILRLARATAARIAENHPEVILLSGSFARGDFSARSDMDLLILLKDSNVPIRERIADFLEERVGYPTDVFPLTERELKERLEGGDPFWTRAAREASECYPDDKGAWPWVTEP